MIDITTVGLITCVMGLVTGAVCTWLLMNPYKKSD
jgi:hypothetical protein